MREKCQEFGEVENVTIIKNFQTNKSKRCGFVKFVFKEDAERAKVELKKKYPEWIVEWATSTKDPDMLGVDKFTIYIGGLDPYIINKSAIKERFGEYGDIEWVKLVNPLGRRFMRYEDQNYYFMSNMVPYNPDISLSESSSSTIEYPEIDMFGLMVQQPIFSYAFVKYKKELSAAKAIENENGAYWINNRIKVQYCETLEMKLRKRLGDNHPYYYPYFNITQPLSASQLFVMEELMGSKFNSIPLNINNEFSHFNLNEDDKSENKQIEDEVHAESVNS